MAKSSKRNPRVFLDFQLGIVKFGRVVIELFADVVPRTCENFRGLCTGEYGVGQVTSLPLSYVGCKVLEIIPGQCIRCGDFERNDGKGGESIYGGYFDNENYSLWHTHAGIVSMYNDGPHTNGSQFYITLGKVPLFNRRHVVFGQVRSGMMVLRAMTNLAIGPGDVPEVPCFICGSGEVGEGSRTRNPSAKGATLAKELLEVLHKTYEEQTSVAAGDELSRLQELQEAMQKRTGEFWEAAMTATTTSTATPLQLMNDDNRLEGGKGAEDDDNHMDDNIEEGEEGEEREEREEGEEGGKGGSPPREDRVAGRSHRGGEGHREGEKPRGVVEKCVQNEARGQEEEDRRADRGECLVAPLLKQRWADLELAATCSMREMSEAWGERKLNTSTRVEVAASEFERRVGAGSAQQNEWEHNRVLRKAGRRRGEFCVWDQETVYKNYERDVSRLKLQKDAYANQMARLSTPSSSTQLVLRHDTTGGGPSQLGKIYHRQTQAPLRRARRPSAEPVNYINRRNKLFNKRLTKAYGEEALQIKQNLERGTAL